MWVMTGSLLLRRLRYVLVPLIGALLVGYFGYHAVQGNRGLLTYLQLTQEIRKAELTRDLIRSERDLIERRVKLLRPDAMDRDMLEERSRQMLNLGHRDEVIVMVQRAEAPAQALPTR
jgi:cell division protein FtsB